MFGPHEPVASLQTAIELKPNKKLFFTTEVQRSKTQGFCYFAVQATFLPVSTNEPIKVAEQVYCGVLQHPTKFQTKILTGKFCA